MKWVKPVKDTFILLRYFDSIIEVKYYNSYYYSSIISIANYGEEDYQSE